MKRIPEIASFVKVPPPPDVAPLADADGREDGDEDEGDGGQHDDGRVPHAGLGHDPAAAQEDDDAEDVDEAGGEDAVPGAEQDPLRHQEVGQPPGGGAGALA